MQPDYNFLPNTQLQSPFSYAIWPIYIVAALLLACGVGWFLLCLLRKVPKKVTSNPVLIHKDTKSIKSKYINLCNELSSGLNSKHISLRQGYQRLNELIRFFVFEITGIKMQNCTLSDIKQMNMPILSALVEEYYKPEFEEISMGDISSSLQKTKEVIELWK